jgi:REP element-mobilizing transposase RayT
MLPHYLHGKVAVHQRKTLPHWDADHGAQFLTLRLAPERMLMREGATIVAETMMHDDESWYELLAWCVMPDHLHVLLEPYEALARIVKTWKSVTARRLGGGVWWQADYYDRLIRDPRELENAVEYIMNNPEAAELADWDFRGIYPERLSKWL